MCKEGGAKTELQNMQPPSPAPHDILLAVFWARQRVRQVTIVIRCVPSDVIHSCHGVLDTLYAHVFIPFLHFTLFNVKILR